MELLPAIDLRRGKVVRLRHGDDEQRTTYELAPEEALDAYVEAGATRVHMVDLDAALGEARQTELIERLASRVPAETGTRLQVGGGLRDRDAVEWALNSGIDRVVITSMMARDFALFSALVEENPERVVAALDVRDGELKTSGWTRSAEIGLEDLCALLNPLPLGAVLVTDISKDGAMSGPNLELACELGRLSGATALLSGGVSSLDDLVKARRRSEIGGAIVGKALYDGAIDLHQALAVCAGETPGQASDGCPS